MIYFVNTFIGFFIAQIVDIKTRNKESLNSPKPFKLMFFIKDTWLKIVTSLTLSMLITLAIYINVGEVDKIWMVDSWIFFIVVGAVPEVILQLAKDKLGWFQPSTVSVKNKIGFEGKVVKETFVRK